MQEAIHNLPDSLKSSYALIHKALGVDLPPTKQKALALVELDDVFVEFQRLISEQKPTALPQLKLPKSIVPVIQTGKELKVDARTLHTFLESKRQFADWFQERVEKYGWVEGEDYFVVTGTQNCVPVESNCSQICEQLLQPVGRPSIDYHMTLSMAKELGMVENNNMGRKIRKYFIECEERLMTLLKDENVVLHNRLERDCSSIDWLREKSLDKIEAEALVTLRNMWKEERDARLDFMSETYKEVDIKHKGTAKEVLTFLRPQLKAALTRLRGAYDQLNKHYALSNDSILCMRLEGVIEDFSFVEQWTRKTK